MGPNNNNKAFQLIAAYSTCAPVQNGWGVQKSSAASRAEIQFVQHPLTRSAQKFTVAMTRNLTIVRQIVYPSEHSLRMLRWIYEYDLRESTTV
jgi:hypothetical protein